MPILLRWTSFWSWRVYKQPKLWHLGYRKPARIHWKTAAPKTSHCLVRISVQRHNLASKMSKEKPSQSMAIVIGSGWTNFCSQKLRRRMLATFGFNRTALCATQPNLHSIFCGLFLKGIISRRADVVWPHGSWDLTPLEYYLWSAVKDKCYADKPVTIDNLKDNICEPIGKIQLHTIDCTFK